MGKKFDLLRALQIGQALASMDQGFKFQNALEGYKPGAGTDQNALGEAMRIDPERGARINALESAMGADRERKKAYIMAIAEKSFDSLIEKVGPLDSESPSLDADLRQALELHERAFPGYIQDAEKAGVFANPKPYVSMYNRYLKKQEKPGHGVLTYWDKGGTKRSERIKMDEYNPRVQSILDSGGKLDAPKADTFVYLDYVDKARKQQRKRVKADEYNTEVKAVLDAGGQLGKLSKSGTGKVKLSEMKSGIDSILTKYKIDSGINLLPDGKVDVKSFLAGKKNAYQTLQDATEAGDKEAERDLKRVLLLYEQMWAFLQAQGQVGEQPPEGQTFDLSQSVPSHTPAPGTSPSLGPPGAMKESVYDFRTGRFTQ